MFLKVKYKEFILKGPLIFNYWLIYAFLRFVRCINTWLTMFILSFICTCNLTHQKQFISKLSRQSSLEGDGVCLKIASRAVFVWGIIFHWSTTTEIWTGKDCTNKQMDSWATSLIQKLNCYKNANCHNIHCANVFFFYILLVIRILYLTWELSFIDRCYRSLFYALSVTGLLRSLWYYD